MAINPSTPLWQLTVAEFIELNESMKQPIVIETKKEDEVYLKTDEAFQYLNVSRSTLLRWKKDKYVKSEKKGGILRFKKSELDKVLNQI